jgi:hypothetical protein
MGLASLQSSAGEFIVTNRSRPHHQNLLATQGDSSHSYPLKCFALDIESLTPLHLGKDLHIKILSSKRAAALDIPGWPGKETAPAGKAGACNQKDGS